MRLSLLPLSHEDWPRACIRLPKKYPNRLWKFAVNRLLRTSCGFLNNKAYKTRYCAWVTRAKWCRNSSATEAGLDCAFPMPTTAHNFAEQREHYTPLSRIWENIFSHCMATRISPVITLPCKGH